MQALVMGLYLRSRAVPAWALVLLCLSKRLHSIFILRLFNDCLAVLVGYAAIWLLLSHRWRAALLTFSMAVSVKMNILLLAPAVLIILMKVYASPCLGAPLPEKFCWFPPNIDLEFSSTFAFSSNARQIWLGEIPLCNDELCISTMRPENQIMGTVATC